ncbi:MAG: hypothetical protein WC758_07570 [Candidatus Woesearchaeota archaeon]|jgi:hypothetical protein
MINKKKLFIGIIIGVVVLALVLSYFFVLTPYLEKRDVQNLNYGAFYAASVIAQKAATCEQVPLPYGNLTINIIAVECLQK